MKSHELAEQLLASPNVEVTASVDISTNDDDAGRRAFGDEFDTFQVDGVDQLTLLFVSGYINDEL